MTLAIDEKIREGELAVGSKALISTIKQKLSEGAQGMYELPNPHHLRLKFGACILKLRLLQVFVGILSDRRALRADNRQRDNRCAGDFTKGPTNDLQKGTVQDPKGWER